MLSRILRLMLQAEDWLPEQHLALPHSVARPACFPRSAVPKTVSVQDVPGQAEARAAAAPLPAPAQPARQCGGAGQIYVLPRYPILIG